MPVLRLSEINQANFQQLLKSYSIELVQCDDKNIPGSFWGDEEAGLIDNKLYCRSDTPVHSALHEACHYICMDEQRRKSLDTNAGGDYDEENGVCYLQILLADKVTEMGRPRMFKDMDEWGYSFRLGSAQQWFEKDAEDALDWLIKHNIINSNTTLSVQLRR